MQNSEIKIIEDLSLNAWPSHQMQLYDGWILRFSYFYTHRTNCVEQIGESLLPLEEKIPYCEEIYRRWKSPCIFKITPLSMPRLDAILDERGYEMQNITRVMCRELGENSGKSTGYASEQNSSELACHASEQASGELAVRASEQFAVKLAGRTSEQIPNELTCHASEQVPGELAGRGTADPDINSSRKDSARFTTLRIGDMTVRDRIPDEWIDALFAIKGNATVTHLKIVPSMYAAIPKDVRCAYIRDGEKIVATGLGILDRDYIGIYAINVEAEHRRQGLARRICETLLEEGRKAGAKKAYLQVVANNAPAIAMYRELGFAVDYTYWFRVKETM